MFLLKRKEVSVEEICSNSVLKQSQKLKVLNSNFSKIKFTGKKLYLSIARTIISRSIRSEFLIFEGLSTFFKYHYLIDHSNKILTLDKYNFENLRDFSKTARLGELAQGLTFIVAQEVLSFPIVVDFEGFLEEQGVTINKRNKTPDFILQNSSNYNLGLIESKGQYASRNSYSKMVLKKALEQCTSGRNIIKNNLPKYSIQKSYGLCVQMRNDLDTRDSSKIQIVDPEYNESNEESNEEVIRYHYAAWFILMGDFEMVEKLLSKEKLQLNLDNYIEVKINNRIFLFLDYGKRRYLIRDLNFRTSKIFPWYWWFDNLPTRLGILKDVLDNLQNREQQFSEIDFNVFEDEEVGTEYTYFMDGTISSQEVLTA